MFNAAADIKLVHVPYKGAAPAIQDLLGGRLHVVFTSFPSVKGFIDAQTLRALAVTSAQRSPAAPDIPTIAESGFVGFDVSPWFGIFGSKDVPADRVALINASINEVLTQPDIRDKFAAQGAIPLASSPESFRRQVDQAIDKWALVVKESGATMQ